MVIQGLCTHPSRNNDYSARVHRTLGTTVNNAITATTPPTILLTDPPSGEQALDLLLSWSGRFRWTPAPMAGSEYQGEVRHPGTDRSIV